MLGWTHLSPLCLLRILTPDMVWTPPPLLAWAMCLLFQRTQKALRASHPAIPAHGPQQHVAISTGPSILEGPSCSVPTTPNGRA